MKHIGDIINVDFTKVRDEKEKPTMLDPLCVKVVDQVFVKMALLCRGFDSFYADRSRLNAEKTQWVLAFTRLGLRSRSHIQLALNKLEELTPPNPVQLGVFLSWRFGTSEELGFPNIDEAYQISILMNRQFSTYVHADERVDTVIRHAISQIDCMLYRNMNAENARKTFNHYYDLSLKQFIEGKLQVIPKALPQRVEDHPSDKPRADSANAKCMDLVKRMATHAKQRTMPTNNI